MGVQSREATLNDYLSLVRRRKSFILLALCLVVGASMVGSYLQTSVYSATAKILLQARPTDSLFGSPQGVLPIDPTRQVRNETEVILSPRVRAAVAEQVGGDPEVTVSQLGETDVIRIRAEDIDPRRASEVANAYANAYISLKRTQLVDELLAASQQIQAKVNDLQVQIDAATGAQRDQLVSAQSLFKQRLDQLQVDATLKSGGAQLVAESTPATEPFKPRPLRNAIVALAVGLIMGVALAFVIDRLDDSVKSKEDLEGLSPGLQVLGLIPEVTGWKTSDEPYVVSLAEPTSPAAEAYRTLRTAIQFLGVEHPVRRIQLTSANAQEGKTTTLANLGVALARSGQRVVLMCCDLRRPRIHEFFGLSNSRGVTSVLLGDSLGSALQKTPVDRLFVLASGPLPPNPSELLSSRRVGELVDTLVADGYMVLLDCPPVLPVTDALVLAKRVDATLLVCSANSTTHKEVRRGVELLQRVDAPLVGAILNGVTEEGAYGYAYRYYGDKPKQANGRAVTNGAATNGGRPGRPAAEKAARPLRRRAGR